MAADDPPAKQSYPFFTLSGSSLGSGLFGSFEKPLPPPPPSVEVLLSEASSMTENWRMDSVQVAEGVTLLKGRVSTNDVFGVSNSDLIPGKYEGGLKLWEGSLDLIKAVKSEVESSRLSLNGKRVLELGCGHGLPGIFACLNGASTVHFQDFNAEVLRSLTIPNVKQNLLEVDGHGKDVAKTQLSNVRFFAGDWRDIHKLLDCSSGDEHKDPEGIQSKQSCGGYDVILMAETVYSLSTIQLLYDLIKNCIRHPHGAVYLAGKKHYFGVGGGTRQFLHAVNEDGAMTSSLLAEVADGSSNVREIFGEKKKCRSNRVVGKMYDDELITWQTHTKQALDGIIHHFYCNSCSHLFHCNRFLVVRKSILMTQTSQIQ